MRLNYRILFLTLISAAVAIAAFNPMASAQSGVDSKTRDLLIQKLTQVYFNLAAGDSAKTGVTLRLADLHAERARQDAVKELAEGCTTCNAGKADREKALSYYQEVLPGVPEYSVGKVLSQIGHLYEMTGKESDAISAYEKLIKEQRSNDAVTEAHLSLAELYFKKRLYIEALPHYQAVLAMPRTASRGLAAYRSAWCEFNNGHLEAAINDLINIVKTPELLTRSGSDGTSLEDRQFKEEVSRDLAIFLARRTVAIADANLVYEISPDSVKIANVTALASEAERLGQVEPAIAIWRFVMEKQNQPLSHIEGSIHIAQLEREQKRTLLAVKDFETATGIWSGPGGCKDLNAAKASPNVSMQDCVELKSRLRKFVLDWNRLETKSPSTELLSTYQFYLKTFPDETDMMIWAAKVACDLKNFPLAFDLYTQASSKASAFKSTASLSSEMNTRLEASLLGAIEVAELSKDPVLLSRAYDSYLSSSKDRKKAVEVSYQKAHSAYEHAAGKPTEKPTEVLKAAEGLRTVALSEEPGSADIKRQAAELSLDALVLLKDDARIEIWAREYAAHFPLSSVDFPGIARKAILTQSALLAASDSKDGSLKAWEAINRFDIASAPQKEKISFYRNKLILAQKLSLFPEARDVSDDLLRIKDLSSADRDFVLARKAWLAEMVLDFDGALLATSKMTQFEKPKASGVNSEQLLKLAMYAELAAKDAKPFYSQFLKQSRDEEKNAEIAAELVRGAKEPMKELARNKAVLMKRPQILAALDLEISMKTGSLDLLKKGLAEPSIASSESGSTMKRLVSLDEAAKLQTRFAASKIESSNQAALAKSLKSRVALLDKAETLASEAVEASDWTSEAVTLDLLAKENMRFYNELLALPVPSGLSASDERQYLSLLSQQAAPHQTRAQDISKKLDEFWLNEKAIDGLEQSLGTSDGYREAILLRETRALSLVAPDKLKTRLSALVEKFEKQSRPTITEIESARRAVRVSPLDKVSLEKLLVLEKKMDRPPMVAYLEGRIQSLDGKRD
jgi:tetratricopeptide (TPR) repeat protein